MRCPFCGKEMIPGFIQAGSEVFFTEKKHKVEFLQTEKTYC